MDEHLPELRRSVYGQRLLYESLGTGFVVGLAAQIGGHLLRPSRPTEPLGLVADLLYALGWALWTGVVVAVFVQVVPEAKRRQIKRTLDAYEATLQEQAQAGSDQASGDYQAPTAGSGQGEQPPAGCDTARSSRPSLPGSDHDLERRSAVSRPRVLTRRGRWAVASDLG